MAILLKELAKLGLNTAQSSYVSLARTIGLIDFPVPPNSSMRKTSSKSVRHYYDSGLACYLPIAAMAQFYDVALHSPISVLDFGCGVGRQLLHFTRHYPAPRYYACDIDRTNITFVASNFNVNCYTNSFSPPLRYDSASMDMIYSVSTFSHFTIEHHKLWLAELVRILKPGGHCFLTTEGLPAFSLMRSIFPSEQHEKRLKRDGFLYREYPKLHEDKGRRFRIPVANTFMGIDLSYGNTVLLPSYIRENWPQHGVEVLAIIEGIIDKRQDLIVMRKPN